MFKDSLSRWHHTEKENEKTSEANKGRIAWNKGLTGLEGHMAWNKEKTKKDYPQLSNSGARKGHIPWNKGKTKKDYPQFSNSGVKKGTKFKGRIPWNKGLMKETDERVRRICKINKGIYCSKEWLRKVLRRRIPTCLEKDFQKIVDEHNLPYRYVGDGSFIIGHYNPDFINTNSEKVAVEVYAKFHKLRNHKSIRQWKEERRRVFTEYGWDLIFFDETQVNEDDILKCLK